MVGDAEATRRYRRKSFEEVAELYDRARPVYPDSVSVVPFIFGAAAYLWLLISDNVDRVRRFGRRFTGEGRDVDVWETSPLSSAGRRLAIVGVLVAILLPLLIPQMSSSFVDQLKMYWSAIGS